MTKNLSAPFAKIIKNQAAFQSGNIGCNLLITRMRKQFEKNPTPQQLDDCVREMNRFFEKYESIMLKDIELIGNL